MRKKYFLNIAERKLELGKKTVVMGILNVTPDSFSDGGKFFEKATAVERALKMAEEGADIIDIGGESTRPGAESVTCEEELLRVIPIIEGIRKHSEVPISIDTYKSATAKEALRAGANIINDISGCRFDPEMPSLVAESKAPIIVMHIKGTPRDMQKNPVYSDVVAEVIDYLNGSIDLLVKSGVDRGQIIVDPGIGFGKTVRNNLEIMNRLGEFQTLGRPILMGVSRKSVIGQILDVPAGQCLIGTIAAVAANIMEGAHIVRVHDVLETRQAAAVIDAIINSCLTPPS